MGSLAGSELSELPTVKFPSRPSSVVVEPSNAVGSSSDDLATRKFEVVVNRVVIEEWRTSDPNAADRFDAAMSEMPCVGQTFLDFKLIQELGNGAFGRVFLAKQKGLADRLVALKIAADLSGESQRLAQLQHTNIVPIYSEHHLGNLVAVCMPYCGSTTLSDVCKNLWHHHSMPTSGKHLISTLFNKHSTVQRDSEHFPPESRSTKTGPRGPDDEHLVACPSLASSPTNLSKIEQMSYVDAVLWMASRLADGLAHAHERGIIHRDLKPANVLVCDDGQPMLLDFNLAEDTKLTSSLAVAQMGGTLPYMSPEHLISYRDGCGKVDGRADLYSLGLILYYLLTGRHAFPVRRGRSRDLLPLMISDREGPPPRLRRWNRAVSPAVEAIVRRCLEPDRNARYATARDLVEDIERHRAFLPLQHTAEPSLFERAVKWSRRHPRLASPTTLSALIAAIMLAAVSVSVHLSLQSKSRDLERRRELAISRYHDFQADYHLAQDLLTTDDPVEISRGLKQGEKAIRDYGVIDQADWLEQPMVKELSPPDRARLQAEVGEIAFLMARAAHFLLQDADGQAMRMNDLAHRFLEEGARPVADQQRLSIDKKNPDVADPERVRQLLENAAGLNVRGRFLLACEHAAQGRHREALRIVDGVVVNDPNDFGAWSLKGRCHQMLDQDTEAIAAYGTAIALRPTHARAYLSRAAVLFSQQTRAKQALQDLDQAVKYQPNLMEARLDRALVLFTLGKLDASLNDLDWVVQRDDAPARVWFIRSRVRKAKGDVEGARRDHERGLQTEPSDAVSWVSRGMAKLAAEPEGALADFIKAESVYPRCVEALNNQAYVYAVKLKKPTEAIDALDRLLKHFPDNPRALGYRAILKARTGQLDEAVEEVRKLAKAAPFPEHLYRTACVLAIASEKKPTLKNESLRYLASALTRGWGIDLIASDKDLDAIRDTPEFKQFASSTKLLRSWSLK